MEINEIKNRLDGMTTMLDKQKTIIMSLHTFRDLFDEFYGFTIEENELCYKGFVIGFKNMNYGEFTYK